MDTLSKIAQGIFLGNGEVWNFLDYAVNRECGGLLVYTQKNNFLRNNIYSNFRRNENGKISFGRRYESSDIAITDSKDKKGNNAIQAYDAQIGELYGVNENAKNSRLNFTTKKEFLELGKKIRDNIYTDGPYDSEKSIPETYITPYYDDAIPTYLPNHKFGDIYNVSNELNIVKNFNYKNLFLGSKIREKRRVGSLYNYSTDYNRRVSDGIYSGDINILSEERPKVKLRRLDDVADGLKNGEEEKNVKGVERPKPIREYIKNNKFVINNISTTDSIVKSEFVATTDNELFSEKFTTTNLKIGEKYEDGVLKYYSERREKYKTILPNILYPKSFGEIILWTNTKQYGIEGNHNHTEYSVTESENVKFNGDADISYRFREGSLSSYDAKSNNRIYSYFDEIEGKSIPSDIVASVSEGSTIKLGDFDDVNDDNYSLSTYKLLKKTNELFKTAKINSLVNRFHTNMNDMDSEMITSYTTGLGMSRGRNLVTSDYDYRQESDKSSGYDNPYCRVWTAHHQYSKLKDRIRPFIDDEGSIKSIESTQSNYGALRPNNGAGRLNDYSVLRDDGFVRISPTNIGGEMMEDIKRYMFSIENLAWKDINKEKDLSPLSKEQIGDNGGRIMWFPPYNLKFSENINVNWSNNTFIGRGEEIYTYTNTARNGTLDFTLLVDHPSILNKWRGTTEDVLDKERVERDILRFFAGCGDLNSEINPNKSSKEISNQKYNTDNKTTEAVYNRKRIAYVTFFPNNLSGKDYIDNKEIEDIIKILSDYNISGKACTAKDVFVKDEILQSHNNVSNGISKENIESNITNIRNILFGGDDKITEIKTFDDLINIEENFSGNTIYGFLKENCEITGIEVKGFASSHGTPEKNIILRNRRRDVIEKILRSKTISIDVNNIPFNKMEGTTIELKDLDERANVNTTMAKLSRAAYVIIDIEWKKDVKPSGEVDYSSILSNNTDNINDNTITKAPKEYSTTREINEGEYTYDNEYLYFSEVKKDSFVYKNIVDKVRYFDPAYHSITPEGFNQRLTFLHQCTRQGPTNAVTGGKVTSESKDFLKFAGNLSFGRAPYCILRIGDFFNTKICIESISIQYDNNGVQWDLNPEGIGVQPMYANVSISFKFLGGQDIARPIERLQNAVTANYYANASIYSEHADTHEYYYDAIEKRKISKGKIN